MSIAARQRSATVKVGVLTLLGLALLIYSLIWLRGRGLTDGHQYDVLFQDVNGMRDGTSVQMMGIRVGFVEEIEPVVKDGRYFVRVVFTVNDELGIKIPKGSTLSIEQSGFIGEQFLEITPPQLREITLTTFKQPAKEIKPGIPVKFLYEEGYLQVGEVEKVEKFQDGELVRHRLHYRITRPGAVMPEEPLFELAVTEPGDYYLRVISRAPLLASTPEPGLNFTVENPLRMKRFLEIQMESAEALRVTNEKINELLSDETIATLQGTLKNTEVLTARANDVLDSANMLLQSSRHDLNRLVVASEELVLNVTNVSRNVNEILEDPQLKAEMQSTVTSLRESSNALRDLLNDPALKETIYMTRDTSRNAAALLETLRETAQDTEVRDRMSRIMVQLDSSLTKLDNVLTSVGNITTEHEDTLDEILEDTRETADNLRNLSEKFSGHFVLWKLLF